MKKGSAVALPSGTRYGAHVAPQRCTILRNGKAVISYHIRGVFYPLKFKIVLDMGYTSLVVSRVMRKFALASEVVSLNWTRRG